MRELSKVCGKMESRVLFTLEWPFGVVDKLPGGTKAFHIIMPGFQSQDCPLI